MAKYLVIVESPTKVKTIKKFLGSNYTVAASNGHVRDFPKSQFGIDVEHGFEPKYITIRGKGELLAGLRKEVKKRSWQNGMRCFWRKFNQTYSKIPLHTL